MKKIVIILVFFIILALPTIVPLFHSGFFQSDDGEWMIIRFSAFHQALSDGQFPVRFLHRLNHGYGYPVANFLYPGFMYLGETLKLLGIGFVDVIKITLGISLVESALFSFFWLRHLFGKWEAFFGSLFFLYVPYHLFDVYKRGSVGETLSLATVPFILWQIESKSIFWTSLGVGLLILSHNTLAILFLPVIIFYGYLRLKNSLFFILYSLFFGLGLSAFFWIPALYDLQYTVFGQTKVSDWGHYFSGIDLIGFSTIFVIIVSCVAFLRRKDAKTSKLFIYFLILAIGSIFLATAASELVWKVMPVSFVQFPFRFLSVTILCGAFLASFFLEKLSGKAKVIGVGAVVVLLVIGGKNFATPSEYFNKGDEFYATNEATTTVQDEYMPKWVLEKPNEHFKSKVEVKTGNGTVSNVSYDGKRIIAMVLAKEDMVVTIHTIYFPGWSAYLNDKKVAIEYGNKRGLIELFVPPGDHKLEAVFEETPVRLASDVVSICSGVVLLFFVMKKKST